MRFIRDFSVSAATAGFVAVLVGFTSSVAIVFQAALSFGATPEMIASWIWALGLGMGLCSVLPSYFWRVPVMVAWSTPGAAVLAAAGATGQFTMGHAVGAFLLAGLATVFVGATGWFENVVKRVPASLANALLAGVLARFGMQAFTAAQTALPLVALMLLAYLLLRQWTARYAVSLTFAVGVAYAALTGQLNTDQLQWTFAVPLYVAPEFSIAAFVGLAVPLWVVTMASQNLPGVAAIRACGFGDTKGHPSSHLKSFPQTGRYIPVSKVMTLTGVATVLLAPFGGFALNLSAITAAICMGPEAHEDRSKRYIAAVVCGLIYIVIGIFGAAFVALLAAFPTALVFAIAGLALLGTIGASLHTALAEPAEREAALITFLVTLSGVVIGGVGSAFWGVVAGTVAWLVAKYWTGKRPSL
jgi:benzoate membrane transport protein